MENYEDKQNNELLFELKKLEADHEAQKVRIINEYDKLTEIESLYEKINDILAKRLNPST
jgi:hypothetical protein